MGVNTIATNVIRTHLVTITAYKTDVLEDFFKCRSIQSQIAHSTVCRVLKFCVGIKRNKNVKLVPFTAGGLFSPNSSFADDPPNVR